MRVVTFEFKHRAKSEMPAFFEKIKDMAELPMIKEFISGWDLTEEFNDENLGTFLDNYHNSSVAITSGYVSLLTQFKKGN